MSSERRGGNKNANTDSNYSLECRDCHNCTMLAESIMTLLDMKARERIYIVDLY